MIATAISAVKGKLTGLGIIDRYGGLSIPVQKTEQVAEGKYVTKIYPIREGVDARSCFTNGRYEDLMPDERYKNLVYWEEISGMTEFAPPQNQDRGAKFLYLRGQARLIYWLNLPKMGHDSSVYRSVGDAFAWTMIDAATNGHFRIDSGSFEGATVRFSSPVQSVRDLSIFSRYSYDPGTLRQFMLYPFDFGAVTFQVEMVVPKSCVQGYTAFSEPIECQTEW